MTNMEKRFLQSEIRQKIIEALLTDLIVPRKGAEDVLEENPELSYLTGALHTINRQSAIEWDEQEDLDLDSGDSDALGEEDNEDKYATKFKHSRRWA
jgi:hypothetical protein